MLEIESVDAISDEMRGVVEELWLASGEIEFLSGTATDVVRRQVDGTWKLAIDNPYGIEQKG
jgi:ketosteroid isomerase-like protein